MVTLAFDFGAGWVLWALVGDVFLLSIASMASGRGSEHLEFLAFGVAGIVYACLLPGFLLLMSREVLWVLIATVWAGDTAAYYGGRLLGRHRLAPVLSPNKTVEGALAGGIASVAFGAAIGSALLDVSVLWLMGVCLIAAVAGQLGDLAESAMKRTAGVKDSANRLPGHGGVLDRVDSLLFAAPVFQFCMMWIP
jgi:phosphatidate cytidylyltransferase